MFYYLNILVVYLLKVSNKYAFIEHDRSLPNSFLAFTGGQSLCCNILATVSSFPKKGKYNTNKQTYLKSSN